MKELILGGARSGKSGYAEDLAIKNGKALRLIATGQAADEEMAKRIAHHQAQRNKKSLGKEWRVLEEPIKLSEAMTEIDDGKSVIIVDCLTLWLSNAMHKGVWGEERRKLITILPTLKNDILFVSNEVGSGVVPLGQLSREFVDQSGWLHQALAKRCERVTLIVAGLPLSLKPGNLNS